MDGHLMASDAARPQRCRNVEPHVIAAVLEADPCELEKVRRGGHVVAKALVIAHGSVRSRREAASPARARCSRQRRSARSA